MAKIKIFLADGNYLVRKGLEALLLANKDFVLVDEACDKTELLAKLKTQKANILIIDYISVLHRPEHIKEIVLKYPDLKIMAIAPQQPKTVVAKAIESGVISYLLKECDKEEITEAIYKTAKGEKFVCGKVLDSLLGNSASIENGYSDMPCDGVNVTEREMEIIKLVAEGYSNKLIADKLFLSTHTVTTHRKNIMNKLGVANTAGLVLYAVRQNLISPNRFLFSAAN